MMPRVELTVGAVEYEDSGADGPVVVLLHGLVMDGTVWRDVVTELPSEYRVIRPTLPFGAHREPMKPDADLSLRGLGRLVAEHGRGRRSDCAGTVADLHARLL